MIDEHKTSSFSAEWLLKHSYSTNSSFQPHTCKLEDVVIRADEYSGSAPLWKVCQERVARTGAAVVRGAGTDTEAILALFNEGNWHVVPTHFGRFEDLRTDNTTNANTDQLGYTDAPVELHSDQTFLAAPPRFQMLHCIRQADSGGDNTIADIRTVARYLAALHQEEFDVLRTTPVTFHRQQRQFQSKHVAPILDCHADGSLRLVRSSYFTMDPMHIPFSKMEAFYRAYSLFVALTKAPAHHYSIMLQAGDFLVYDNHHMLHARTAFKGPRWLRGVYFENK